ncbi:hypothetical protein HCH_00366 [Hahella chejuensis KCTC 2396]|uniref:Uncharacterized protein n=1 Tax=Hahella chejuensis (strain KCTC 2396) TaxID=349521 RepID=Q2SPZ6_HAHCH|nr:hypothetical protein HCH_00366 [Hahella chejuensis KCTC 2396]
MLLFCDNFNFKNNELYYLKNKIRDIECKSVHKVSIQIVIMGTDHHPPSKKSVHLLTGKIVG